MLVFVATLALALSCGHAANFNQVFLDAHNDIRRTEAKTEHVANLYELVWDAALESSAKDWSAKCNFEHQHIHNQGENLYYAAPYTRHDDPYYVQRALNNWMSEKSYNDDGSFDCCYHGTYDCCHYTQVVAARTMKVGCAVTHCEVLKRAGHTISHKAAFIVCDYSPMGNMAINGHHNAYASGAPCSQCAHGDHCNDGLCVA